MKPILPILLLWCFVGTFGQQKAITVTAEQGDGIFSILRKQGLDPVKYYGDFLTLNKDRLKDGTELVLGQSYAIPTAEDSFKKMAVMLNTDGNTTQKPLFNGGLGNISPKSTRLKNAVIYLVMGSSPTKPTSRLKNLRSDILTSLAEELMVHGAKVYLLDNGTKHVTNNMPTPRAENNVEAPMANLDEMRGYVDVINAEYLKNIGKYQRMLVLSLDETMANSTYHRVSVMHDKNPDGARFAKSIQQTLKTYAAANSDMQYTEVFEQKNNLFLAKNAMPPITLIAISDTKDPNSQGRITVKPEKKWLTNSIANGILYDYASLAVSER